jgi:ATP-dependent 26S proteasome regulatory subunit
MDERWFVQRPDEATRLNIMKVHLKHHQFEVDDEGKLLQLANGHTKDWVGAELASLITEGVFEAIAEERPRVSTDWLIQRAGEIVAMANQAVYRDDLKAIEEAAGQFRRVGRIAAGPSTLPSAAPARKQRAGKAVSV